MSGYERRARPELTAKGLRPLPPIRTEVIGRRAAIEQAEADMIREPLTAAERRVAYQTYLPLMGGPHDGSLFRVPTAMIRERGEVSVPIRVPIDLPGGAVRMAIYRLDRTAPPRLRYVRTDTMEV